MDRYENGRSLLLPRNASWRFFRLGVLIVLGMSVIAGRVEVRGEDDSSLEGAWRLVLQSPLESEAAVIEIKLEQGRPVIRRVGAPLLNGINPTQAYLE